MATITYNCPHYICGAKNTAFETFVATPDHAGQISLFGVCCSCGRGTVLHYRLKMNVSPHTDLSKLNGVQLQNSASLVGTSPRPQTPDTLADLPPDVAKAFNEAEDNRTGQRWSSAGVMYRKAIERGLKHKFPDGKGLLNARIRSLEKDNALPHSLIELLDQVKFLGNDGAHDDDPTAEDVASGAEFTRLFLTYMFVLPAQIVAAKTARDAKKGD